MCICVCWQCDPHRESGEVLSRLLRRDRRLVVLGGNCHEGSSEKKSVLRSDSLAGLRSVIPQVRLSFVVSCLSLSDTRGIRD